MSNSEFAALDILTFRLRDFSLPSCRCRRIATTMRAFGCRKAWVRECRVVIKTFAGCRVTVKIPATITVGEIRRIWGLACHWSGVNAASRFVANGRNVLDRASIGDLQCDNVLVLHMIAPHRGGGAKSDRVVSLKSDTARWLLSQGISLASVTDIVDQLQSKAGNLQLEALLEASDKARWNKFSALCEKVNVSLPDRVQSAPRHVKGPDALNAPIDVASLTIEPGFFQNPDGEPTQIVRNLTPKGTGIVLLRCKWQAYDSGSPTVPIWGNLDCHLQHFGKKY